jgi:hypothetical protein
MRGIGKWTTALAAMCVPAGAQLGPLEIRSLTPPSGSGYAATFRLAVSDGKDGSSVSNAGIRIGEGCLAYWDRNADAFFLANDGGTGWRRMAAQAGGALENSRCRLMVADSHVTAGGDPVTVEFALQFLKGFEGSKLIYAYASAPGDTRNTGWQEVGSWKVTDEGVQPSAEAVAAAAAGGTDPNDLPAKELDRPATPYQSFLQANPGATELTHQQGQLLFKPATGKRTAIFGPVTHRDLTSGAWVPNAPVLSETNNGWRLDGTQNALLIKKHGVTEHTITQTYTDYTTRHDSTLTLTVPSLVYDTKSAFHYVQDGLTWKMVAQPTGSLNLSATVAARRGAASYNFNLSSSETLSVDANGNLVGDAHVVLTRAIMIPKVGARVMCSAWTYSRSGGATFTCDDSALKANQFPYTIDPQTQTFTDGGSYHIDDWRGWTGCDDAGNNCNDWGGGSDHAVVYFNTSGLVPNGGALISTSCSFNAYNVNMNDGDGFQCGLPNGFNNSGSTREEVWIDSHECDTCGYSNSADVNNISLTVTWAGPVTVTVSPSSLTVPAGGACGAYAYELCAAVESPNTAATFSLIPAGVGSFSTYGLNSDHCAIYCPPAVADGGTITAVATAAVDPSKTGTASITITVPAATVSVSPGSVTLQPSQGQQFWATVSNRVTQTVNWTLSPNVGTINSAGVYTAPATIAAPQTVTVIATSVLNGSLQGTATITLLPFISVTVSPAALSLGQNQTQQFTATVQYTSNTAVTWSLSPAVGTINGSGLYTAPGMISSSQTVTVIATSAADGTRTGAATISLMPVAVGVTPAAGTMNPSRLNQMTSAVSYAGNTAVTWSMVSGPGAIGSTGVYVSPISVASAQRSPSVPPAWRIHPSRVPPALP